MDSVEDLPLQTVLRMMTAAGVCRCYLKALAPNDNSKNQPYLGGDFGVLNVLPSGKPVATTTGGDQPVPIFRSALDLWWLGADGTGRKAPEAKLILYPQYPEVRLSGYLTGVDRSHRPSRALGTTREPGRVLLLGVTDDGRIVGAAAAAGSPLAHECLALANLESVGVLRRVPMPEEGAARSSRELLLHALCRVASKGWIDSHRLDSGGNSLPCASRNCGGYTLEAELGVRPNGLAEPDFHGWEVKQFGVNSFERPGDAVITLMTPEPTDGVYATEGVLRFVEQFGYPDVSGKEHRLNFGGVFRHGERATRTGLTLHMHGFDASSGRVADPAGGFYLLDDHDREAAIWRFSDLLDHWRTKHAFAAYVPSIVRRVPNLQYRYTSRVRLGEGTSFERFLSAVDRGDVYLDPGIKVENYPESPRAKKRNQFRVKASRLSALYGRFDEVDVCG